MVLFPAPDRPVIHTVSPFLPWLFQRISRVTPPALSNTMFLLFVVEVDAIGCDCASAIKHVAERRRRRNWTSREKVKELPPAVRRSARRRAAFFADPPSSDIASCANSPIDRSTRESSPIQVQPHRRTTKARKHKLINKYISIWNRDHDHKEISLFIDHTLPSGWLNTLTTVRSCVRPPRSSRLLISIRDLAQKQINSQSRPIGSQIDGVYSYGAAHVRRGQYQKRFPLPCTVDGLGQVAQNRYHRSSENYKTNLPMALFFFFS